MKRLIIVIVALLAGISVVARVQPVHAVACTENQTGHSYAGSCMSQNACGVPDPGFPLVDLSTSNSTPACSSGQVCCYQVTWPAVSCTGSNGNAGTCRLSTSCDGTTNSFDTSNSTCDQGFGGCCYPSSSTSPIQGTLNFDHFNTVIFGKLPDASQTTPKGFISHALPILFVLAGLILFVMIVWGGFEMLTGAANEKSQEAGKQRITAAIIGFILIFSAYWIAQIIQLIFGISIL